MSAGLCWGMLDTEVPISSPALPQGRRSQNNDLVKRVFDSDDEVKQPTTSGSCLKPLLTQV